MTKKHFPTNKELKDIVSKEELYDLYVIQNKNRNYIMNKYSLTVRMLTALLKLYNIKKLNITIDNISKETLYNAYIVDNLSVKEISEKYKLSENFIRHKISLYKIKKPRSLVTEHSKKYKDIDKNYLYDLYIVKNLSAAELARLIGLSQTHMMRLLKRFGFEKTSEQFKEMQIHVVNERYAKRTEEERLHKVEACKKIWDNMTKEQKQERLKIFSKINKNRTLEHQAKLVASFKRSRANETPEQKAERIRKVSEGTKKAIANMSEEKKRIMTNRREEALRKNGTFRSSMPEFIVGLLLKNKFTKVNYQYKSNLYPYKCDFYIPELDLYIEYQGNPGHGNEPFNETNQEHIKIVNKWKELAKIKENKLQRKSKYSQFVYIWTNLDVKKRKIAKENNLNLLEFFNMNQFLEWYKTQSGTLLLEYKVL